MNKIILFDVDGTLTDSGSTITQDMIDKLILLSKSNYILGVVGGGSYNKIITQLHSSAQLFTYIFAECGSVVYIDGILTEKNNMLENMNDNDREYLNEIIRQALFEISLLPIIFHGCQIDIRLGLIYISPPGMQATSYERLLFMQKDKLLNIRQSIIHQLKLKDYNNIYDIVLGGSVGIALYKKGRDKSQVMKYFNTAKDIIHFFGDKTDVDGNDYPLYSYPGVNGHTVANYIDTINQLDAFL